MYMYVEQEGIAPNMAIAKPKFHINCAIGILWVLQQDTFVL